MGCPIRDSVLSAAAALTEPTTAKDPTKVVTAFLARADEWKSLHLSLEALRAFLADQRHFEYDTSRRIAELATNHPVPPDHGSQAALERALKDMQAIIGEKSVVERWSDYRLAYDTAHRAYRDAYRDSYTNVQHETERTAAAIRSGTAYKAAPDGERVTVWLKRCSDPVARATIASLSVGSAASLLDAAAKRSLSSLAQALVALPGYQAQVESDLRALVAPPPPPGEKVWEWRPSSVLAGQRFQNEAEVDEALDQAGRADQDTDSPGIHGGGEVNGEPQALLDDFKDAVKGWVPKVREVLDKDFTAELRRLGIPATGKPAPLEKMNLPAEDKLVRTRVEALLRRDSISEGIRTEGLRKRPPGAELHLPEPVDRPQVHGGARTPLSATAGRSASARRSRLEIITYVEGQAWSPFLRDLRAAGGSRYKYVDNAEETLLRDGLTAAYRFITSEIRNPV